MSAITEAVKNQLDNALAKVQGEVGRFLILKERIRAMPQGITREDLLLKQDALEKASIAVISQAQALRTELEGFNPFSLSAVAALGPKVNKATGLAKEGLALVSAIQAHKTRVESATGSLPPGPEIPVSPPPSRGRLVKMGLLAAVLLVPLGYLAAPGVMMYLNRRK